MGSLYSARQLLADPDMYPIHVDWSKRSISFVRLNESEYSSASFLDNQLAKNRLPLHFNLDDLLLECLTPAEFKRPVVYILHSAFCCSTLLSRYFDRFGDFLVVREPGVLASLMLTSPLFSSVKGAHLDDISWLEFYDLALRLMHRGYDDSRGVVVKVNDLNNILGERILCTQPEAKLIILSGKLRDFIPAVLKSDKRRKLIRARLASHAVSITELMGLSVPAIEHLEDSEAAATLWAFNQIIFYNLLRNAPAPRMLVLDSDQIADMTAETLARICEFSDVAADSVNVAQVLSDPEFGVYSKRRRQPYTSADRDQEKRLLAERFSAEIDRGMSWGRLVLKEISAPCTEYQWLS